MFSCCWHWQLLSMAESAVNPAMPLPLTSYHLPHTVLPKPKKGSTHQQLRRPPPSPPRHHHCRIPGKRARGRAGHGSGQPTTGGSADAHSLQTWAMARAATRAWRRAWPDSLFLRIGGGVNAEAGPRGEPRGGGGCLPTAGSTSHWSRFRQYLHRIGRLLRRRAPGVAPGGALPRMPGRGGHAGACVAPLPVSGWSASQNTRHHVHDTDAAAGRRRRRRLGPRPQTRRSR